MPRVVNGEWVWDSWEEDQEPDPRVTETPHAPRPSRLSAIEIETTPIWDKPLNYEQDGNVLFAGKRQQGRQS